MIQTNPLIAKISELKSSLNPLDPDYREKLVALMEGESTIQNSISPLAVPTAADLPSALNAIGSLIYVEGETKYYYSDGFGWQDTFDTAQFPAVSILSWGRNEYGQCLSSETPDSVPWGNTNEETGDRRGHLDPVVFPADGPFLLMESASVSTGREFSAIFLSFENMYGTYGYVTTWGGNIYGQLGDSTTNSKSSPVSIVGGFNDWTSVGCTFFSVSGIRSDGTAWSWGRNTQGQLGDGTRSHKSSPVSVVGGFTDWSDVALGARHVVALRENGTLWAWGTNDQGQLGDGTTAYRSSPVSVVGGFTDWSKIECDTYGNVALRDNGTLWSWGGNMGGGLGDGTTTIIDFTTYTFELNNKSSPVSVVGGFTDWVTPLPRGGIRNDGTLWAWGINNFGEVGDGTTESRSSPVSVLGGFTDWVDVTGQIILKDISDYSITANNIGQRGDGTLWEWGNGKTSPTMLNITPHPSLAFTSGYHNHVIIKTNTGFGGDDGPGGGDDGLPII